MPPPETALGILDRHRLPVKRPFASWPHANPARTTSRSWRRRCLFAAPRALEPLADVVHRHRRARKRTETNPMVRTTTAPTILEAGIKENVLPSTARGLNF